MSSGLTHSPARTFASLMVLGILATLPMRAHADRPVTADTTPALVAERVRLRAELDRLNAEIDVLKRAGGVSDDYRLRARLADAELAARRLIEIEAHLGVRAGTPAPTQARPTPTAAPGDGPADLDAKADILADQSRRLRAEAETLGQRAKEIRGRQDLRRRVSDLDRDPFAAMEGPRRRVASVVSATHASGSGPFDTSVPAAAGGSPSPPAGAGAESGPRGTGTQSPAGGVPTAGSPSTLGNGATSPATTGQGVATGSTPLLSPVAADKGAGGSQALAAQLRDLLDTATLTDLTRLELRTPGGTVQALERVSAALRARAAELEERARAMRTEAHLR